MFLIFSLVAISLVVMISAFLLSLQTVLWDPMLLRPSPKVICPALTFQGFRHVVQGSSSGVAAPAPFKAAVYVTFLHRERYQLALENNYSLT